MSARLELLPSTTLSVFRALVAVGITLTLLPALLIAAVMDDWTGEGMSAKFFCAFAALGLWIGASAFAVGQRKRYWAAPAVYWLCLMALPFLELSPTKPAFRAVRDVRPGMREAEVRAVFDRHFPVDGPFPRPIIGPLHEDFLKFPLDPEDSSEWADCVLVQFAAGKCVWAHLSTD